MRIAYVTSHDPTDRLNRSGSDYGIMRALMDAGLDVTPIGPLVQRFWRLGSFKRRFYRRFRDRSYDFERSAIVRHGFARQIEKKLSQGSYDFVFSASTIPISRLRCDLPVAIWVDATWQSYNSLYETNPPWCRETLRAGHITERQAYERCSLMFFRSQWAADSAINDYGVSPDKVRVAPGGANFIQPPERETALGSIRRRSTEVCRLVSVGAYWKRKGMARSVALAVALNEAGLRTELVIVGCSPPPGTALPDCVTLAGFIDKRTPDGETRLSSILMQSHFHVLFPSGEAYGFVFAEASAHALPNITWDIGGIATAVASGENGHCFAPQQPLEDVVAYVVEQFRDRTRYEALARASRQRYEAYQNWKASGTTVRKEIEALIAG